MNILKIINLEVNLPEVTLVRERPTFKEDENNLRRDGQKVLGYMATTIKKYKNGDIKPPNRKK